ncbi:MAG: hypothetical protein JNM86_08765 [Phycisphaerae bacterium]|nr:hypothetical protein [Phycisphaerae bacterium]
MLRARSLVLALSLASGLAAPATAETFLCLIDGNALKMGGSSTSFFGVPFRAVRDDVAKTVTFYIKGDVKFGAGTTVQLQVTNSPYPVRVVFGNDAEFPGGLQVFAGTAGAGAAGLPGTGGPSTPGRKGDGYFYSAWGGWGGKTSFCLDAYSGGDGGSGRPNALAEDPLPGTSGTPGTNGGLGINQSLQLGGFGIGGAAGSPAPITSRVEMTYYTNGGQGGSGGFVSGTNGADGDAGRNGPDQNPSAHGGQGGDATLARNPLNFSLYPILISGNAGGSGAGAGGGAPGNGGEGGSSGGGGGGGGSTACDDGGDGGNGGTGGGGQPGGNAGAGGNGNFGGAGGGAIEITALGRLIISSGNFDAQGQSAAASRIAGSTGTAGLGGYNGGAGSSGQHVNSPAGDGGAGGKGGRGGRSGDAGNGGAGGLGTGGSGGTIFLSATELNVSGTYRVSGGTNGIGPVRSDSGRAIVSYNHTFIGALSASPSLDNGPLLPLPGPAPEASQASPYINGGPVVPYIAGLQGGAAVAGIIPGLKATTVVNPATLPPNTVAGLLMLDSDVPGITYDKNKYRALLYLNYSPSPNFQAFLMGLGGLPFSNVLNTHGWANDPRFGGNNGPQNILALGDAVYVTLVPVNQLNQNLARVGGYFRNATNTSVDLLTADSTTFGVGTSKMLTVQRRVCNGDFNSDGLVDDADFQVFVIGYNILDCADSTMPAGCPADISRDGFVDDTDFQSFAVSYNALVCP